MKTILVTGGAGFIGSCFVRRLIAAGRTRVVTLDKLTYAGNLDSLTDALDNSRHHFVQADVADADAVARVFAEHRPDAVVHFAAETHVDRSIDGPLEFVAANVVATVELLEQARRYWRELPSEKRQAWRFLHVSTDEVYGSLGPSGRFTEATAYQPNSPYAASKAAADHFARAYFRTYDLPALTTHCSNNYGPYQFPEKLIPLTILNAIEGKSLPVYGDGRHVRDWIFVEDHCDGVQLALEKGRPGETYNFGGAAERSNLEVVRTICRVVDELRPDAPRRPCEELITMVEDRPGHDRRYAIDSSKARSELGWAPQHAFDAALAATVRWYLRRPDWIERVASGEYRRELPGRSNAARPVS